MRNAADPVLSPPPARPVPLPARQATGDGLAALRGPLAALALCVLLPSLGTSIANVALPALAQAFGSAYAQVQWVVLAYLLANCVGVVAAGRLGDRFGLAPVLRGGLLLFIVASAGAAAAPSLPWLVAARALQGLAAAALMALALARVAEAVPRSHTGRAMGLLGTMSAVGTALGPSLGGALLALGGWRAVFAGLLPAALLALWWVSRGAEPATGVRGQAGGAAADARPAAPAAAASAPQPAPQPAARPATWSAVLHDAWHTPAQRTGLLTSALVAAVMMATLVLGPFYLGGALGLPVAAVGLLMSVGPAASALAGVPAGRLVDRFGPRRVALAGLMAMGAGCGLLGLVPLAWGAAGYLLPLLVLTGGYALFQAANNTAVMAGLPADRRGTVSGLLTLARNAGLMAGAAGLGAVFSSVAGGLRGVPAQALLQGLHASFLVAGALVLLALGLVLRSATRPLAAGAHGSPAAGGPSLR